MAYYNKTSPYFTTSLDNKYLDVINFRDIPAQADDVVFTVTKNYEYRPDLLAYDLYNDVNLWWVFSVRNRSILKDPIFDMAAGRKIYLPKLATLQSALGI
jgi:hypothetical protein